MTLRRVAVLAVLLAPFPFGAAHADGPDGDRCRLASVPDGDLSEGVLYGGPIAATGTLTCTVQVDAPTHDGADAVSRSASGVRVVAVAPETVWFEAATWQDVYVCTQFTPALGAPLYLTEDGWSTDPAVPCDRELPGVRDVERLLDALCAVDLCFPYVDPFLYCPLVASLAPGVPGVVDIDNEGDLHVDGRWIWDCPPYGV